MEEVRQLVAEEGREARNLIAFHVAVDLPVPRISRKPPRSTASSLRRADAARATAARVRSASAGRDKRAELQARYWALLFGNLQRAIGEIYTTVESHENLSECQEVILVLENYTRDFKALCEWFRLKWEYDNTPPPQRPQSLAWEVRKTDFVRPESRRTNSVKSSPSVSGKNSPSLSGHNTPSGKNSPSLSTGKSSPGGSGKISPRVLGPSIISPKSSMEFFGPKSGVVKISSKPEHKSLKETSSRLSDIKEKVSSDKDLIDKDDCKKNVNVESSDKNTNNNMLLVEIGTAKESRIDVSPKQVVMKTACKNITKTTDSEITKTLENGPGIENQITTVEPTLTAEVKNIETNVPTPTTTTAVTEISTTSLANENLDSMKIEKIVTPSNAEKTSSVTNIDDQSTNLINKENDLNVTNLIIRTCDKSENFHITKKSKVEDKTCGIIENMHGSEDASPKSTEEKKSFTKSPTNESKPVNTKAPYSQAAAKPKTILNKPETKSLTPKPVTSLTRSKTAVELKPNLRLGNRNVQPKRTANHKCSYPFNLTTGRPSLFDGTPNNNKINQRNINRTNSKTASGDRPTKNEENRKISKRPDSLKIEDSNKTLNMNPVLEKLKHSENNSSTDTIITQIDRNESSESLKTLVPDYEIFDESFANSIEVLNVDNQSENDNDGWFTVKSRRLSRESKKQSKSHWVNRFNQPSATTSLPTLNMIESPKQENKPIVCKSEMKPPKPQLIVDIIPDNNIVDVERKSQEVAIVTKTQNENNEQPDISEQLPTREIDNKDKTKITRKMPKVNVLEIKKPDNKSLRVISTAIIRQKSDVTGLKTRSSRNRSLAKPNKNDKKPKIIESEFSHCRLHSSLESLIPSGLSRSQESTECAFDFDTWKCEFKSSLDYLEDEDRLLKRSEYLKTADPEEMSEIALMTCEIEENERKISLALDFQSDVDQKKLCEEEDLLNRQIKELQQVSDIEFDTETDDTETDAEILCEDAQHLVNMNCSMEGLGPLAASLEDQYEPVLAGLSWAERVDTLATLEALVARYPGRAQQLHAKLSQGIRRRGSLQETLKRYQLKQARAEHQRQELQSERTHKIHQLLARVEDVKAAKNTLIEEKRLRMEQRLQKAAENRDQYLKDIVRKAHDEEEKLREIAFIKQLSAEHRRQDFLDQCRTHTARLRQMRRDRLYKLEQKAAREAAVGARRLALEEARAQHVSSLLQRRRERDARVVELRERTRQRRHSAARQKAADVKSRLTALAAAAHADAAALRSRIRDKQDATRERHAEHLRAIRTRAQPARQHTTSEGQDVRAEGDQVSDNEEPEMCKEKLKAVRKKARKMKQKLLAAGEQYENNTKPPQTTPLMMKNKMCRALSQLQNLLAPVIPQGDSGGHEATPDPEDKKRKRRSRRKRSECLEDERSCKNSVCSSASDLSRQSRNEVVNGSLNGTQLDRCLNELSRIMEKMDQSAPERALLRQASGLRPLCLVLALAERETAGGTQIQEKSIVTCCNALLSAVCSGTVPCVHLAADLLLSNGSVHAAQILLQALESSEADSTSPLVQSLCDLLSVLFETVVMRVHSNKEDVPDDVRELRQRSLLLVSYLAVSGLFSRACEVLYRLVISAARLCEPLACDPASGGERAGAWRALRASLGTRLCGARAQLAELSVSPLPSAAACAPLAAVLRAVAERDPPLLQASFSSGGALEFSAAVGRLLAAYAPVDKDATIQQDKHKKSQLEERLSARATECLVLDLIVLIGFFVINNEHHLEALCAGHGADAVRALGSLPAAWLCAEPRARLVLPTVAALAASERHARRIAADMSLQMIEEYVSSPEAQSIPLVRALNGVERKQKGASK